MKLETYEMAIAQAKATLGIDDAQFELLPSGQAQAVIRRIEEKFVEGHQWHWWWEHLREQALTAYHAEDAGFEWLGQILPEPEATVWLVVQPFGGSRDFSVYAARTRQLQPVIGECNSFEYCVVAQDLSWLIGENHHGAFFFVGEPVTARIREVVSRHPEQWRDIQR